MGQEIQVAMEEADAMLLGRVTYEEWAAFFPSQSPEDVPSADYMNEVPKFVGTRRAGVLASALLSCPLFSELPRETVWKSEWDRSMTYAFGHEKELLY